MQGLVIRVVLGLGDRAGGGNGGSVGGKGFFLGGGRMKTTSWMVRKIMT